MYRAPSKDQQNELRAQNPNLYQTLLAMRATLVQGELEGNPATGYQFKTTGNSGLVHPIECWDVQPPIYLGRQRSWDSAESRIIPLPGYFRDFESLPEIVWAAVEGGRARITTADAARFPLVQREVRGGHFANSLFLGQVGSPITLTGCRFEDCLFWVCQFQSVVFSDCQFAKCRFLSCKFQDILVQGSRFQSCVWGDKGANYYNEMTDIRLDGVVQHTDDKTYGPTLWMTPKQIQQAVAEIGQ